MKLLHLADTHLGYSAYRAVTAEGVNQREMDVYASFQQCIDYAVQQKPDLVIHAGDLFDSVRPTNRAISVAVEQLLRLSAAKIPCVVVSGNHETPRLRETGSIFTVFDHLKGIIPVYKSRYEVVRLNLRGKAVAVHCIPQCLSRDAFEEEMAAVAPSDDADVNLCVAHGAVKEIAEFRMNECNEQYLPVKMLSKRFDYIALGHYHKCSRLQANAYYVGSTERLSFAEAMDEKGMLEVNLGKRLTTKFIPLRTRPMVDAPVIACEGKSLAEVQESIREVVRSFDPAGKVVRVSLAGVPSQVARALDVRGIREWCRGAVHVEVKLGVEKAVEQVPLSGPGSSLAVEFERFVQGQSLVEKEALLSLGLRYLRVAGESAEVEVEA